MSQEKIKQLEMEIYEKYKVLSALRKENELTEISNYTFESLEGEVSLLDLFADKETLLVIHNMGQGCRYCTLWADGLNPFLPHLEQDLSVVLASKDSPQLQRKMANERNWRFRMVSHKNSNYIQEQNVSEPSGKANSPGVACYVKKDNKIYLKNKSGFGPGDEFCSAWNILSLAGHNAETWTPQFNYWKRPSQMDDGGENLN